MDPLEDDDDIQWKHNPFDVDHVNDSGETPEELLAKIASIQAKALVLEFIDVFATKVRQTHGAVEPMKIVVDPEK